MKVEQYHVMISNRAGFGPKATDLLVEGHDVKWDNRYVSVIRYEEDGTETATFVASPENVHAIFIEPPFQIGEVRP